MDIERTTLKLGDREFAVAAAPIKRSRKWRRLFEQTVMPLLQEIAAAKDIQFDTPGDLLRLTPLLNGILITGIDQVFELVVTYSDVLEAERAYIEENASDKQVFAAFLEVLRLSDPFGLTGRGLRSRLSGLAMNGTSASSPSASGESVPTPTNPSPSAN